MSDHRPRIVLATGCFDLLHAGHVQFLTAARGLGDELVIAVNSDDSIRRLKGINRPIDEYHVRRRNVETLALGHVWRLDEDDPVQLLYDLRPAVLAKGRESDVPPENVRWACSMLNVELRYTGELQGVSTTRLAGG